MHTWSLLHQHRGPYQTTEQKHQNPQGERTAAFFFYKYMLRWFAWVRRTQALSYPHQFWTLLFKGKYGQQVKSPEGAVQSTEHWSSLALPSCSSHLLLRCFPPGILKHYLPLAVLSNKWCSQKKTWWLQCSALLQLSPGKAFQDLLAKGGPGWGDRQVRAGSWDTWWSHSVLTSFLWLCLQFTAKTTPVPRIPHMKVTQAPLVLINRHLLKICCSSNPFLITHRSFSKEIQKQNP